MKSFGFDLILVSFIFCVEIFTFIYAQTPKNKHDKLKIKADSLQQLLNNEREENDKILLDLKTEINKLNEEILIFKKENLNANNSINYLNKKNILLNNQLLSCEDSLKSFSNPNNGKNKKNVKLESTKYVKIGTQIWMTENLNVAVFKNGDPILRAKTDEEWKNAEENKQSAWCYYNNDPKNGEKYGKLYNLYAVNDPRGLAPDGWHIPTDAEWLSLEYHLGKEPGKKMKAINGWNEQGNGTNSSGFTGLPGGFRHALGDFLEIGSSGYWWGYSTYGTNGAYLRALYHDFGLLTNEIYSKGRGYSIRCVKD